MAVKPRNNFAGMFTCLCLVKLDVAPYAYTPQELISDLLNEMMCFHGLWIACRHFCYWNFLFSQMITHPVLHGASNGKHSYWLGSLYFIAGNIGQVVQSSLWCHMSHPQLFFFRLWTAELRLSFGQRRSETMLRSTELAGSRSNMLIVCYLWE